MKRKLITVLIVAVLLLSLSACGGDKAFFSLYGFNNVDLTQEGYSLWINSLSISIKDGDNAFDVISRALEKEGYIFADESYIYSITTPGGETLSSGDTGPNSGWLFAVNGVIPDVAMQDIAVHNGDHIYLQYVNDFNTDVDWDTNTFVFDVADFIEKNIK